MSEDFNTNEWRRDNIFENDDLSGPDYKEKILNVLNDRMSELTSNQKFKLYQHVVRFFNTEKNQY